MSDILNVIQRWESLGLLEGLPVWEKEELAQVYDNATRLLLSEQALKKIPKDVFEIFDNVYIPIWLNSFAGSLRLYNPPKISLPLTPPVCEL